MRNLSSRAAVSSSSSWLPRSRTKLLVLAVAACFASNSHALPTDPVVANGNVAFAQNGNVLTVTNSNGAIINWKGFSIGANETTRFIQTSASSSVLNRVLANDPSLIYGTLASNGRVWLVNPAGIMVGPGARIDTAGFVASTLNIRNEDFLAGRKLFESTPGAGSIVNQGSITTPFGGTVYLIAPNVTNAGIITTPQGETLLAAGQTVSLLDTATPGVKVDITGAEGNVTNLGSVVAEAGRIGMVGVLVKNSGTLNASSVVNEGGRIFLKASHDAYVNGNGRIIATGIKGGSVEVLGNRVAVMDSSSIDASGTGNVNAGGGGIMVGGDYQGKNPDIQNASITYFGPNASLKADAGQVGDGGTVIVWADGTTRAYGNISARGGALGGNGGFVETSGHRYLDFNATVDRRAPKGKAGLLLLDPSDIEIGDSPDDFYGGTFSIPGPPDSGIFSGSTSNLTKISWATIDSGLGFGDISITTSGSGGNGDITFASGATLTKSSNLGFLAHRHIATGGYTLTGAGGNISLVAGWDDTSGVLSPTTTGTTGGIAGVGHFITNGGNFTALAAAGIALGNITTTSTQGGANAGNITVTGGSITLGNLTAYGAGGTDGGSGGDGGNVNLTANSGNISIGNIETHGGIGSRGGNGGNVIINAGGGISVGSIHTYGGNASSSSSSGGRGGDVSLIANGIHTNGKAITVASIDTHGGEEYDYDGSQYGGDVTLVSNSTGVSLTGTAIAITSINTRGGNDMGSSSAGDGGTVNITAASGGVTVASIDTHGGNGGSDGGRGGAVTISATNGSIAIGQIDAHGGNGGSDGGSGGAVTLTTDTGNITAMTIDTHGGNGGTSYGRSAGGVTLTTNVSGDISVGIINAFGGSGAGRGGDGGNVSVTAGSGISIGAINTYGGNATGSSNSGGRGRDVSLTANGIHANGKAISVASIDTRGGQEYNYDGSQGGGNVTLVSNSPGVSLTGTAIAITSINTRGGNDIGSSSAGDGGTVNITTASGGVAVTSIDTRGGNAASNSSGGRGGSVSISATYGSIAAELIDVRGGNGSSGGDGGDVSLSTILGGNVSSSTINVAGGVGNTNGAGGSITIDAYGNISFKQVGDLLSTANLSVSSSAGNIAIDVTGNIAIDGGSFITWGNGASTIINSGGNMDVVAISPGYGSLGLVAGGTLNLTGNIYVDGSLVLSGGSIVASGTSAGSGLTTFVSAGSLSLTNGAYIFGGYNLAINAGGDVNLSQSGGLYAGNDVLIMAASLTLGDASYVEATSGKATIGVTNGITLDNNSYIKANTDVLGKAASLTMGNASHVEAISGLTAIDVAKDITLDNGSYIKAGTDVKLALNGSDSLLTLNSTSGQTPSYIWAQSPSTIFLSFPLLASGGVVIDGKETLETLAGFSGLFVGPGMAPAKEGAGLNIAYLPKVAPDSSVATDLVRAVSSTTPERLITLENVLQDDPRRLSSYTAGGESNQFGDEEGKDEKDKGGDTGGDKARPNKGKQRVATCN